MPALRPAAFFERILSRFPRCDFAAFYGSGVYAQEEKEEKEGKAGVADEAPMVDLLIGTRDAAAWHRDNGAANANDYVFPFRSLNNMTSGKATSMFQELGGARMWFNPYVEAQGEDVMLKYGVISMKHLEEDLSDWSTLYCAGRLHKPVLVQEETERISGLRQQNLRAALIVAAALLPNQFTEFELYEKITSLSYMGDPRFAVGGENANKVANIVRGNVEGFRELYADRIDAIDWLDCSSSDDGDRTLEKLCTTQELLHAASVDSEMPPRMQSSFSDALSSDVDIEPSTVIESDLSRIVRSPAAAQAVKGVVTAGIGKSVRYGLAKLRKGGVVT